jgi:hypothetical protein
LAIFPLLQALACQFNIAGVCLPGLLDESVQQDHFSAFNSEQYPRNPVANLAAQCFTLLAVSGWSAQYAQTPPQAV